MSGSAGVTLGSDCQLSQSRKKAAAAERGGEKHRTTSQGHREHPSLPQVPEGRPLHSILGACVARLRHQGALSHCKTRQGTLLPANWTPLGLTGTSRGVMGDEVCYLPHNYGIKHIPSSVKCQQGCFMNTLGWIPGLTLNPFREPS